MKHDKTINDIANNEIVVTVSKKVEVGDREFEVRGEVWKKPVAPKENVYSRVLIIEKMGGLDVVQNTFMFPDAQANYQEMKNIVDRYAEDPTKY